MAIIPSGMAMSHEEYEYRRMQEMAMRQRSIMGIQQYGQDYAAPVEQKKEAAPKRPSHLNPKLLLIKGA